MYDDDRDALAAEYVLGTLSTDERDQAEALLTIDPGFAEIVRVWERRLGELNVMVEAVEPPSDVWDRIQSEIGIAGPKTVGETASAGPVFEEVAPSMAPEPPAEIVAETAIAPEAEPEPEPEPEFELAPEESTDFLAEPPPGLEAALEQPEPDTAMAVPDMEQDSEVAVLASSLLPEEALTEAPLPPEPSGRSADIVKLERGVRRWRGITVAISAIAAVLAVFIAVTQLAPGLIPLHQPSPSVVATTPQAPSDRFVAVLQQEPTAPAFLLTVDPQARTFTVRRVSATPEAGRSYELWLLARNSPAPRSLGLVGADEFTTRPIPAGFNVEAMRGAGYAVSLEPAGGSPSGAPTGPILFTGSMVESLPGPRS